MATKPSSDDRARADLLRKLRAINRKLRALRPLEQERLDLLREARAMEPPMTFRELGTAAGVSDRAIQAALRKQDERRARKGEG